MTDKDLETDFRDFAYPSGWYQIQVKKIIMEIESSPPRPSGSRAEYPFFLDKSKLYEKMRSILDFTPPQIEDAPSTKRDAAWFRKQIRGLIIIINSSTPLSKEYALEKLNLIYSEQGIIFHPAIHRYFEEEYEEEHHE